MKIEHIYSHQNGHEHILVHKPALWTQIERVIAAVDATACRTKQSREKTKKGKILYSPKGINKHFKAELEIDGWRESRTDYWVTADQQLIQKTILMPAAEQKKAIELEGGVAIASYNQTDFVKDRIAIEVQFGKYSFVAYDMFVKHMAFFVGNKIDVGVEILPMKALQMHMSSGVPYYEKGLYDLMRQGRGVPSVPLVVVGVVP